MHILVVDDHDLFRQGLAQAMLEHTSVATVLEANSLASARKRVHEQHHNLSLVILDYGLPDGNGSVLLMEIQQHYPLLPVAMLSAHEDYQLMRKSMDEGAQGFIPKSTPTPVLLSAIRLVLDGGIYIPPALYRMEQQHEGSRQGGNSLTKRQYEVMKLVLTGCANKEIAGQLNIAEATVKAHVTAILRVYGVSSRTQLIASELD